jgi:O-antigen/teichoic acid export membrane protein
MRDKLKQLTKDTMIYGISTMVGRFINFLLMPVYTHFFIPAHYGIVTNIYALFALLNIVFLFGMDSAYLKFAGTETKEKHAVIFSTAFTPLFVMDIVLSLLLVAGRSMFSQLLGIPQEYSYLFYYTGAILFLDAIAQLPYITLRLEKKALRFSGIRLGNIFINIILNVFLIAVMKKGIESVFISNLIASVFSLVMLLPEMIKLFKFKVDKEVLKRLLAFGLPYLPAGIASMFMQVIDRPIVEKLTNLNTLGIYQANYRLGIFMMLYVSMFQYAWQPFFLENSKDENAKGIFSSVFTYFTAIGCIILVFLSLFINDIAMHRFWGFSLIGKAYWGGLNIVPIVLLAYLFNGFYVNFAAGLFIKERSGVFPIIMSIGAASNVLANFLLIPKLNITGAAFATLISYALMAIGFYIVSNKIYPIKYEGKKLLGILLAVGITAALYYVNVQFWNSRFVLRMALFILFILMLFIFRVIRYSSFLQVFQRIVLRRKIPV